jgi:hypothetical protein
MSQIFREPTLDRLGHLGPARGTEVAPLHGIGRCPGGWDQISPPGGPSGNSARGVRVAPAAALHPRHSTPSPEPIQCPLPRRAEAASERAWDPRTPTSTNRSPVVLACFAHSLEQRGVAPRPAFRHAQRVAKVARAPDRLHCNRLQSSIPGRRPYGAVHRLTWT